MKATLPTPLICRVSRALLAAAGMLCLLGCGAPPTNDRHDSTGDNALGGTWNGPCQSAGGTSTRQTLTFSGNTFVYVVGTFVDSSCSQAALTFDIAGTFAVGGNVSERPGAKAIDFSLRTIGLTPGNVVGAAALRWQGLCATRDWNVGIRLEFTGDECATAETAHSIISVQPEMISIGKITFDGSTATRPTDFISFLHRGPPPLVVE